MKKRKQCVLTLDETKNPAKATKLLTEPSYPLQIKKICDQAVENGTRDQSNWVDQIRNCNENCAEQISKKGDEKVTIHGNSAQEKNCQNGQIAPRNKSSPNEQRDKPTIKAVHENQHKYHIYRISHAEEAESKLEIRPFTITQDGERKAFVELRNHSNKPLKLPENKELAKIKSYEIWDPGIESVKSIKTINEIDLSKVDDEMRAPLRELLQEYSDIFSEQGYDIGKTDVIQHHIDTGNHRPIRLRPYRTPHKLKAEMKKHIDDMLKANIIKPSTSPWAAPALLVNKHDGSTRFVVDYRALNAVTKFDSYPMPRISDILDQLNGKKYFTCLDLASGYHNVCVDPKSQEKTAFVVEHGLYEYLRMPFGLVSAPASFSRLMDHIFREQLEDYLLLFLDDLIIYSDTLEEHLEHLRKVFQILREAKLKLKGKKCQFFLQEVSFLGHIVTPDGIKPDPAKIEKILNFKTPTNLKQVQSFLGLASYYRRFIKDFSKIAHPLIELTKGKGERNFIWGEDQQRAFDVLRKHLTTSPILAYPDWNKDFLLFTDASNYGIGAILSQLNNEGREVVIAYASRHLNQAEMKYSATEKEALAVVFGVKHFKHYLTGNHFIIISDARPLVWLNSIKDPTGRLARWALELSNMKYTIKYRPGRVNQNADCLSRMLKIDDRPIVEQSIIVKEQRDDKFCQKILKVLGNWRAG
jgi:RNase H-like domain found in reverse transcriptase/Reverse transcriptase (RNA-dependent DNA polymerase)